MIYITIEKSSDNFKSIEVTGHAEFADIGKDIVCSAVSILVINTANSIEAFADDEIKAKVLKDGSINVKLKGNNSKDAKLLLESMVLGLKSIQESYKSNVKLLIKEV